MLCCVLRIPCGIYHSRPPVCQRCTSGAPYLRKFGNPYFKYFGCHVTVCMYVGCTYGCMLLPWKIREYYHGIINWQLSKQSLVLPVSHYHIVASGSEHPISLLTRDWFFNWIAGSSHVITVRKKDRVCVKAKLQCKLTPGTLFPFFWIIPYTTIFSLLKFN